MYWQGSLNEMRHDAIEKQRGRKAEEEDIQILGKILYFLISSAKVAREYGLLAVEEQAAELDRENEIEALLYDAVEMLLDGFTPATMVEIFSNRYWVNPLNGYEATAGYLIIRGILLIQDGQNGWQVQSVLCSMLPTEIGKASMKICKEYESRKAEKEDETARIYFETDFSRSEDLVVRTCLKELELELFYMADVEVQRLLREIDGNYLVPALLGMKKEARQIFARNMSSRLRNMIMADCYKCCDIENESILEAAEYMMEKLRVLQACGEILDFESRMLEK